MHGRSSLLSDLYFGKNRADDGHNRRALRSGAVAIAARVTNAAVQIGSVLFLARLLTPEDYGLVSMVAAIVGFAPLVVDLGTRDAVVQRPAITEREVSAIFWITTGLSSVLTVAVAASGPLIARLYGEPRLVTIALVSSLTFISSALTCQHYALLRRAMLFEKLGVLEVVANVVAAVTAIAMAFLGFHYWALVVRPIVYAFTLSGGVWWQCRWVPTRPAITPDVKKMLHFGVNITGFTMTDFLSRSADRVAIGYRFGAATLGHYQNALFVFENFIDILLGALHGVAVSGLSKVQHDPKALWTAFSKALALLTFFAMPAFGVLAVTSQDLIVLMLGEKWTDAGVLLSIVALRGIPQSFERTHGWLHVAMARTDRWMRWGLISAVAQLLTLLAGLPFGPKGVAASNVACMLVLAVPSITYAGGPIGVRTADVLLTVWRPLTASIVAVVVGFALRVTVFGDLTALARTIALAACYVGVYVVVAVGLLRERRSLQLALWLAKESLPASLARLVPSFRES